MRWVLIILAGACLAAEAHAHEDYASLGDAIVAAAERGGAPELQRLRGATHLDAWIAADEVMRRGKFEAARGWARAAGGDERDALARYVARVQAAGFDAGTHDAVLRARRDRIAARAEAVRERLLPLGDAPDTVSGIRLLVQRSQARVAFDEPDRVHADRDAAIRAALRLGWRSGAGELCREGASDAESRRAFARQEALLRWRVRIEHERSDPETRVDALLRLSRHLDEHGKAEEAAGVLAEAAGAAEAAGSARLQVRALLERARQAWTRDDVEAARAWIEEARSLPATPAERGYALHLVARLYAEVGRSADALAAWRSAADVAAGDDLNRTLLDLGWELSGRGRFGEAVSAFERLLERAREADDREYVNTAAYNLANTLASLERGDDVRRYAEEAMATAEELLDVGRVARSCRQMASVRSREAGPNWNRPAEDPRRKAFLERMQEAFALQEREVRLRIQTGNRLSLGYALRNRAHLTRKMRRYEEALATYRRVLDIARACASQELEGDALTWLSSSYISLGRLELARTHTESALALYEKADLPVMVVRALWQLSNVAQRQERWSESVAASLRAIRLVAEFSGGLSDEDLARLREDYAPVFALGVLSAWKARDHEAVFEIIERGRGLGLLMAMGGRERLSRAALPPALDAARSEARRAEATAFEAYQRARQHGRLAVARKRRGAWLAAKAERQRNAERIEKEARLVANLTDPRVDAIETVAARLRPGEAFVNYVFSFWDFAAQVFEHGKPVRIVELARKKEALRPMIELKFESPDPAWTPAIAHLRETLIEPLGLGPGVKRLLVSHEEELLEIPFGMLAPEYEVAYVPSWTTYGLLRQQRSQRGKRVLAVGDPAHDVSALRLPRLPNAAAEAETVGDVVLVGEQATEAALRRQLERPARWRSVHLACHGRLDREAPLDSHLVLAPGEGSDGLLRAGELTSLRLNADLVVLSACETGRGKAYQTEGVFGLLRAVLMTGAPRAIVSLWRVDDEATGVLMRKFYELWGEGLSTAAALRQAKAFVRSHERWRHPYYWAAWVLWGVPD